MISDLDIWRGANVIINQYGDDAPVHAAIPALAKRHSHGGKTS